MTRNEDLGPSGPDCRQIQPSGSRRGTVFVAVITVRSTRRGDDTMMRYFPKSSMQYVLQLFKQQQQTLDQDDGPADPDDDGCDGGG